MVCILKYIGPFLRMNTLNKSNIKSQLFHLSKEGIKLLTLSSKCGITIPPKELKLKNIPNIDINIINSFSPLLCIYKKANPKLINDGGKFHFEEDTIKKEVIISANAYMTLSLLELSEYYKTFKDIDNRKYLLCPLYLAIAKNQLDFYASYLRNEEGVFVDKKDVTDSIIRDVKFEDKKKNFKFSDQALLMAAYYKYSCLCDDKHSEVYRAFSLDILNMFIRYKNTLYDSSFEELSKLCFAFNIFYEYSKLPEAQIILWDLCEYQQENIVCCTNSENKLEYYSLQAINYILAYNNTNILKFKEAACELNEKLFSLYNSDIGTIVKDNKKKEFTFSSAEIITYILSMILYSDINENIEQDDLFIVDIFKRHVIDSNIILSWPEVPHLEDVERYKNCSLKSEDLLDEVNFKLAHVVSPENCELAPIFIKYVTLNTKKDEFTQSKSTFDSSVNMFIFYLIIHLIR